MSYHAYASTTCWHVTGDWNPMIIASECHRVCPPMTYQLYAHVTHTSCDGAQLCAVRRNRFWPRSRQCCTSETSASARMMPTKPNWRGAWPTSPWRMSPSCSRCGILQYAVCMTCFLHACCTRHALQVGGMLAAASEHDRPAGHAIGTFEGRSLLVILCFLSACLGNGPDSGPLPVSYPEHTMPQPAI